MTRRFRHWAYLNEEGMKIYGETFPEKKVPVLSMIPVRGPLGTPDNVEDFFRVQWGELTEDQQDAVLGIISERFGVKKAQVLDQIERVGLPLRSSLTNGSGTNHLGLFI